MSNNPVCNQVLINVPRQEDYAEKFHISASLVIQMALIASLLAVIEVTSLQPKRKKEIKVHIVHHNHLKTLCILQVEPYTYHTRVQAFKTKNSGSNDFWYCRYDLNERNENIMLMMYSIQFSD
ncbi:MAG: hypothetical protein P0116_15485 [Candidatus Nitrosocosmicus sp.]|nr:hypothetical protein [Candidatus Nitrosocosmicus sp.]